MRAGLEAVEEEFTKGDMPAQKNILVVRADRIGDLTLSTPVFEAIKSNLPESKITALVHIDNLPVVAHNPFLSEVLTYDPKAAHIHLFKIALNYQLLNELKGSYSTQFVPGNTWNEYSSTSGVIEYERGGYATHDVDFTYKPNSMKNTTFNFGVGNIFDKKYVSHNGFGAQTTSTNRNYDVGRNVKLQLSYRF